MSPKYKAFLLTLALALGADQATKMWARHALKPRLEPISVINGYWEFRYAENTGAAFSLLRGDSAAPYLFAIFGLAAMVVIGLYLYRAQPTARLFASLLGLIAGGALGNLIDRFAFGRVTDFVVWRVGNHVWPTFNVADSVLLLGVLGLVLQPRPPVAARA
jgi:signal peptidase II